MARNELDRTVDFLNFLSNEQTASNTARMASKLDDLAGAQINEIARRQEKENLSETAIARLHEAIEFIPNIDRKETDAGKLVVAMAIYDSVSSIKVTNLPDLATRERLSEVKGQLEQRIIELRPQVDVDVLENISAAIENKKEAERKSTIAALLYVTGKMKEATRFYLVSYDFPTRIFKLICVAIAFFILNFVIIGVLDALLYLPDGVPVLSVALLIGVLYFAYYKVPKDAKEEMKEATSAVDWNYVEPQPVLASRETYKEALEYARAEGLDRQPLAVPLETLDDVLAGHKMLQREREAANDYLRSL